jgi:hypothetical protein
METEKKQNELPPGDQKKEPTDEEKEKEKVKARVYLHRAQPLRRCEPLRLRWPGGTQGVEGPLSLTSTVVLLPVISICLGFLGGVIFCLLTKKNASE